MSKIKITDSDHNHTELNITDEKVLAAILFKMLKEEPRVVTLEILNKAVITLGVGLPYGFIEYSEGWGKPPYLMAVNNSHSFETNLDADIEFDSGGTPTPISVRYCLPYDQIIEITAYFLKYNKLPPYIEWEEI